MGAVGHQNGDGTVVDPGSPQTLDDDWKHLAEARLPGRVRHYNCCGLPPTCNVEQGLTGERPVEGGRGQPSRIAIGRRIRRQGADPESAKVESQPVSGEREFDNHGVTISS